MNPSVLLPPSSVHTVEGGTRGQKYRDIIEFKFNLIQPISYSLGAVGGCTAWHKCIYLAGHQIWAGQGDLGAGVIPTRSPFQYEHRYMMMNLINDIDIADERPSKMREGASVDKAVLKLLSIDHCYCRAGCKSKSSWLNPNSRHNPNHTL